MEIYRLQANFNAFFFWRLMPEKPSKMSNKQKLQCAQKDSKFVNERRVEQEKIQIRPSFADTPATWLVPAVQVVSLSFNWFVLDMTKCVGHVQAGDHPLFPLPWQLG